ncbi:hypothetical protein EVAR_48573_1 [Eumeta japonica]|uniref:Uncharacterized protein n=1 Tax=Eumeta variegata TaxID=151549 RepID=A0A4C1XF41_EUMVA|nr:hypothetical protein EVAR_48573_1 [Eumeta japonica]
MYNREGVTMHFAHFITSTTCAWYTDLRSYRIDRRGSRPLIGPPANAQFCMPLKTRNNKNKQCSRRPASAPNGRATAPTPRLPLLRGRAERCARRTPPQCLRFTASRSASLAALFYRSATRPGPRAVRSSRRVIPRGAARAFS